MTSLALAQWSLSGWWSGRFSLDAIFSLIPLWTISDAPPRAPLTEEGALVERASGGDRSAFDELFRRHVDDVYRRLTRLIGPDPEREDLVQEVFIAAYRGLGRFRQEAAFSTWLYRIVVHVAYSHLRKRRRHPLDLKSMDELERSLADGPSLQASPEQRLQVRSVMALLERLKPKKRVAFILRVVEGLSLQEIGEIVDAEPAAVGQRVKHAQRELQRLVEREPLRTRGGGSA
jgi:RNA polymerase sigma-70 factor, ECF subfamily